MRFAYIIFLAVLCMSCSSLDQRSSKAVQLPKLNLQGVRWDNGLTEHEAWILSSDYFRRFVSTCGMPDTIQANGRFWSVQLLGGIAGSDYGRFLFAKDGSEVLLEPPKGGFKSTTQEMLKRHNLDYE